MSDKIAEIRARHAADANDAAVLHPELSPTWALAGWRAHDDRGYLLAEIERLTRERDEARAALQPFAALPLWPDDAGEWMVNEVRSDEDWDEEKNDAQTDDVFIARGDIRAARKALEAKP
jgi:hypothetical protein